VWSLASRPAMPRKHHREAVVARIAPTTHQRTVLAASTQHVVDVNRRWVRGLGYLSAEPARPHADWPDASDGGPRRLPTPVPTPAPAAIDSDRHHKRKALLSPQKVPSMLSEMPRQPCRPASPICLYAACRVSG